MSAVTTALGIDVGTTNVKAALVGADGTVHATASRNLVADVEGELDAMALTDAERNAIAGELAAIAKLRQWLA